MTLTTRILLWITRLVAAIILLQTLYFKFTAQPESVYIFTTVGMEPWGRIGSGIAELIASILLLITRTARAGAILALAVMAGAIFFHLTKLGIEVQNDGGLLFTMALIVASCSALILYLQRNTLYISGTEIPRRLRYSSKA
ncbi:MAG: DoxX family protein [Owenweeksia sp.]